MAAPLRVMTFNLRHHREGRRGWPARREAAQEVARRHAPDLLGTQEALLTQLLDLRDALPHHEVVGQGRVAGMPWSSCAPSQDEDEFVALFYDARKFDCEENGSFWFSDTPDVPGSRHWGNYVPRITTWARLRSKDTGERFLAVDTHLDHFAPRARSRGARLLGERFPATLDEPVVLMGDFNTVPRRFVHRHLTEEAGFHDTFHLARERSHRWGGSFHGFTGRGLARLDWILCRPRWEVQRHVTVRDRHLGVHPSDHFPVLAELAMPTTTSLVPQPAPTAAPALAAPVPVT